MPKSTALRMVRSTVLMMVRPPGTAGDHEQATVPGHYRRRHARQHAFAGLGEIRRGSNQTVRRREIRRRVEVPHLVVEEKARTGHDDPRSVSVLERVGQRDGVAFGIHD